MKQYIAQASNNELLQKSRLPIFTNEEIAMIKGTYDFFTLNYYAAYLVEATDVNDSYDDFHKKASDTKTKVYQDENWPKSPEFWLKVSKPILKIVTFCKLTFINIFHLFIFLSFFY